MNKRGFTLVELLTVIVLLSVIALLIVPVVENFVSGSRENAYDIEVENIIAATKAWEADNPEKIPDLNEVLEITLNDLVNGTTAYIEQPTNPLTGKLFSLETKITIVNNNGSFEYEITDSSIE